MSDDIVEMIRAAKLLAKEVKVVKHLITQREYSFLLSCWPKGNELFKAYLDEHYEVVMPLDAVDALADINERLRDGYLDRLGSLASEQQRNRVAPYPEVSGLRGLGYRPSAVYIDEPHYLAEERGFWCRQAPEGDYASKWLEHRNVCTRALLDCLSGKVG